MTIDHGHYCLIRKSRDISREACIDQFNQEEQTEKPSEEKQEEEGFECGEEDQIGHALDWLEKVVEALEELSRRYRECVRVWGLLSVDIGVVANRPWHAKRYVQR